MNRRPWEKLLIVGIVILGALWFLASYLSAVADLFPPGGTPLGNLIAWAWFTVTIGLPLAGVCYVVKAEVTRDRN